MDEEVEVTVRIVSRDGLRHAYIEWVPDNQEVMETAIWVACDMAARGYRFERIDSSEAGEQSLLLIEPPTKEA